MADNFWTDEKVLEFALKVKTTGDKEWVAPQLQQFKQEQQSKRDWEIVTMIDGNDWIHPYSADDIQCVHDCKIHSVRRLSDQIVFSVGDEITGFSYDKPSEIIRIFEEGNKLMLENSRGYTDLASAKKVEKPKPLFRTIDGKDIYKGGECWILDRSEDAFCKVPYQWTGVCESGMNEGEKYFSTKEAAEEWLLMNSKILSLEDLLSVWNNDSEYQQKREVIEKCLLFNNFKKLAKSKLNTK